jgi:hypothetical protein
MQKLLLLFWTVAATVAMHAQTIPPPKEATAAQMAAGTSSGTYVSPRRFAENAGGGGVPTTRTVNGHALSSNVTVTKADVGLGNADNTSDANKPVSTATQTALNAKLNAAAVDTDGTMAGNSDSTVPSQKAVRTYVAANAGTGGVPTTRTVNGHALSADVTVTKSDVGLGNADNTSDANKPVSTAAQTALNLKLDSGAVDTDGERFSMGFRNASFGGSEVLQDHSNFGSTATIDLANGNGHKGVLNANLTISSLTGFSNVSSVMTSAVIVFTQNSTGGYTVTWPAAVKGSPQINATANAVTIVTLVCFGDTSNIFAVSDYSTGGGGGGGGPQAFAPLTDGATITWAADSAYAHQNAKVTLGGNRTLSISSLTDGMHGTLKVTQGGSGSYTLALPSGSRVAGNGAGLVTLSTAVGAIDKLEWCYDGSYLYWDAPKLNYTAAGDTTPPTITGATIASNGTTFSIGLSEAGYFGAGGNSGFALTLSSGSTTATYSSGSSSSTLVYTLSPAVNAGITATLAYTQPTNGVEDLAGNDLATVSGVSVTNNSTQPPPTLTGAVIGTNGTTLTLTWSKAATRGASYSNSHLDVDASTGGTNRTVTYVSGDGTTTWVMTIGTTILSGETCDLDFTGTANSIEDSAGNDTAAIVSASITNNSTQTGGGGPAPDVWWLKLDESSGTAATADVGPNATTTGSLGSGHCTLSGSQTLTANATFAPGSSVITVMFRMKLSAWNTGGSQTLFNYGYGAGGGVTSVFMNEQFGDITITELNSGASRQAVISTSSLGLVDNTEYHFAVVLDNTSGSGTIKLYVNGVLKSPTMSGAVGSNGAFVSDSPQMGGFDGTVDGVRIYASEVTAGNIATIAGGSN